MLKKKPICFIWLFKYLFNAKSFFKMRMLSFFISIGLGSSAISTVKTASVSLDSFYEVSSGFVLYIYKTFIWLCMKYLCHWLLFLELLFKYAEAPWKLACRAVGNTVAGCFELFAYSQIVWPVLLYFKGVTLKDDIWFG